MRILNLFDVDPSDELSPNDVYRRNQRVRQMAKDLTAAVKAAAVERRHYELCACMAQRIARETQGEVPASVKTGVATARRAMARSMLNLADALSLSMLEALGSWMPSPDQGGTGLTEEEMTKICKVAGIDYLEGVPF